jgi:hypothetical protein
MALLLAAILALIPLAIAPGRFFYFDVTPKVVLFLLGTGAAAIWFAAAGGAAGFYGASRAARWFLWGVCGMAISLAVSTLASVNPALSLGGSSWRYWGLVTQLAALGFACVVAACCAGRPARLRVLLRGVAASGALVAGYGIAQYFGWDPLLDARGYRRVFGLSCGRLPRWAMRITRRIGCSSWFSPRPRWRSRSRRLAGGGWRGPRWRGAPLLSS